MSENTKNKRVLMGTVVSTSMDKTISVMVTRKYRHKLYKKMITARKKYFAHDEKNTCNVGDIVRIKECAPISKRKSWYLKERITESRSQA